MIYLDNAATTYPKPEVVYEALDDANRKHAFNAGRGSYGAAAEVAAVIEDTRDRVGALVGAPASSVVFTASATDALNQIINGLDLRKGDTVFESPFEHNAIIRPLQQHIQLNYSINILIVNSSGALLTIFCVLNKKKESSLCRIGFEMRG